LGDGGDARFKDTVFRGILYQIQIPSTPDPDDQGTKAVYN
jgi:hypothetical protein